MTRKKNLAKIKILVLDVDGVLTDGTLIINADGTESKAFNALDGHGITMWKRAGLKTAFLSGRNSQSTEQRARQLGIDYVFQDSLDKLAVLKKLLKQAKVSADEVAYIGDDLPDLPAMRYVGFGAAVADAVEDVKNCADFVARRQGGKGAVREVIEYILKTTGRWDKLLEKYLTES